MRFAPECLAIELELEDSGVPLDEEAANRWPWADLCLVYSRLGWLWDRCPHWYAYESDGAAVAGEAIELFRQLRAGLPLPELTADGVAAILTVDQLLPWLESDERERKREKPGSEKQWL